MKIQMFDRDGNYLGEFEGKISFNAFTVNALPVHVPNEEDSVGFVLENAEAEFTVKVDDPLKLGLHLGLEPTDTADSAEDWLNRSGSSKE